MEVAANWSARDMPEPTNTTRINPKRRWMTFSLRTLLIAATLLSIVLGYFGNILLSVREKKAIRREIQSVGGQAYFRHEMRMDNEIHTPPGPAIVRWICSNYAFDHIHTVEFVDPNVNVRDQDVAVLLKAPQLEWLTLSGQEVSDRSMKIVGQLHELRTLQLWDTQVSDTGMAELAGLPKLRVLSISRNFTATSYQGSPQITSESLRHIAGLQLLERLQLDNTLISDENLEALEGLKQLGQLWLPPLVSMEKAEQLKSKLPECRILLFSPTGSLTEVKLPTEETANQ